MASNVTYVNRRSLHFTILTLFLVCLLLTLGSWALQAQAGSQAVNAITCGGTVYGSIQAAVDDPACTDIVLDAGYYTETVQISRTITIAGAGPASTIVDGLFQDRVFDISLNPFTDTHVTLSGFHIRGGSAQEGGGIYNHNDVNLVLDNMEICNNQAHAFGGGLLSSGVVTATNTTFCQNQAQNGAGIRTLGIYAKLSLIDSVVRDNYALQVGGGAYLVSESVIQNTQFLNNTAGTSGGGIMAGSPINDDSIAPTFIKDSLIQENTSSGTGGIYVTDLVTIDNTEIISNTGANTNQAGAIIYGGGISIFDGGVLTLTNSTVSHNIMEVGDPTISLHGGGIHVGGRGNRLWMENTIVSDNKPGGIADSQDAVLFTTSAVLDIQNSQIIDNIGYGIHGDGTLNIIGSAVENNSGAGISYRCQTNCSTATGALTIQRSSVQNNGGFGIYGNYLTIKNTLVRDNGGFGVSGTNVLLRNSTVSGHTSTDVGGGVSGQTLTIQASTVSDNHTDADGGGLYATTSLDVTNSTISGNTANGHGGGISVDSVGAQASLDSVTVADNRADLDGDDTGDGGGLYFSGPAGNFEIMSSIVADNRDNSWNAGLREHDCKGDFNAGWSLVEIYNNVDCTGFGAATNQRGVDPQLEPLADNGGPTWTHALPAGSPARDGTDGAFCEPEDQRGAARDTANFCDKGAYEGTTPPPPAPPVLSIAGNGNHILLDWNRLNVNREVEIWRGTDPYAAGTWSKIGTNLTKLTTYTDYDAIGDPLTNYFYAVRGQDPNGNYSDFSNIVGEFDFRLAGEDSSASSTFGNEVFASAGLLHRYFHFALISVPLAGSGTPGTADELAAYIDPENPTSSVRGIARWNQNTQSWIVRRIGSPFGTPDFPIQRGDVLLLAMVKSAPDSFAWVGDVPNTGLIQNQLSAGGVNLIMVPLDQSGEFPMTADGLAGNIGDVSHVGFRSTALQRWLVHIVGKSGINFPVRPGYPYAVNIPAGIIIPPLWPVYTGE